MKNLILFVLCLAVILLVKQTAASGEDFLKESKISGNFQLDAQYCQKDSIIGAKDVPQKILSNGSLYLNYTLGNFTAGIRYESYRDPLLGYDSRYAGEGIAYRFLDFKSGLIDVTAGNFYEQYGSGVILRAYNEHQLGIDNSIEGLRFKIKPTEGAELSAFIGRQRSFWGYGEGILRGGDLSLAITELFSPSTVSDYDVRLGMSVVSKYQADLESYYNLPKNILAYSARLSISSSAFSADGEFAYKYNDPNAANNYNFNPGTALILNGSLFGDGYGLSLNLHRLDNMNFRSDRSASGNNLLINYIPAISKQHAYRLETIFPFSTQMNGEAGLQGDFTYTFPKESLFGGRYGTTLNLNFSRINSLDTSVTEYDTVKNRVIRYDSPLFKTGGRIYFQDANLEISKKWSPELKTILSFMNIIYDRDILENDGSPHYGKVYSTSAVFEIQYKFAATTALRLELQHAWIKQDSASEISDRLDGNWAMALAELTFGSHWYLSAFDEWNYGNNEESYRIHYLSAAIAFIYESTRISFGYGRQRGGVLCIGGVCRQVPASNGYQLSISSSF